MLPSQWTNGDTCPLKTVHRNDSERSKKFIESYRYRSHDLVSAP